MNINFGVAAITERGRELLPALWGEALRIGGEAYDLERAVVKKTLRRAVINAIALDETWNVPTWIEDRHGLLALSQPPVSFEEEVPQASWGRWALDTLRNDNGRRTVHPGYFGVSLGVNDEMEVWGDIIGFGRSYIVQNEHFVAAGNHVGMVSIFSSEPLKADEFGIDVLAQLGYWPEENSPVDGVRRLGAAEVVAVGPHDVVTARRYAHLADHFEYRDREPDVEAAASSLAISTSNAGGIMSRRPTVHLSGGQDSRLTAAAWIAGGRPGLLHTVGNLQGEADVAVKLVEALEAETPLEDRGLEHQVIRSDPRKAARVPIEERLLAGMRQWDGDFAPQNLKAPIRRPPRRAALSVGGGNGEIMHPIYYHTEQILKAARSLEHPLWRIEKGFPPRYNTSRAAESTQRFLSGQVNVMRSIGHYDATAMNVFYTMSKFRRWPNSQLVGSAFVLLLNPAFMRASIDMTPEQRLGRTMQRAMTGALVPQWADTPYFKGEVADFKNSEIVQANRIWSTSPGSMERLLHERSDWKRSFDEKKMFELEKIVNAGEGATIHETTLNKAFVVDAIPDHVATLEAIRSRHWGASG